MTVHNFSTQYNTDEFYNLSYLQTTIIALMLSIGGEACPVSWPPGV